MKYEIVEKNGCEVKIRATVTNEVFQQAVDAAFQKNKAKYTIPGFRKGKAPRSVLEKHLGAEVFYEDAINILLPEYYEEAVKELNIEPVARPDIDIEQVSPNEDFIFSAVVTVAPEFDLEGYKGLEVEKIDTTITDELLDAEIEKSRKQNARILTIENEPAQMGDTVTLDYSGSVDGVKFDGGTAEGHQLKLGSGMFIPGFEDQLVGLNIGQDSVVTVTFPEKYHAENLAGKEAEFEVVIRSIEREQLPVLDDEFIKDISEFDTIAEYKDNLRKELAEKAAENAKLAERDRVIEAAAKLITVEIPAKMIEAEKDAMLYDFDRQLRQQGLSLDQYAKFVGGMDALRNQMESDALNRIKTGLVIEKVIEKEGLEVTDADVEAELQSMAEKQNMEIDRVRKIFANDEGKYLRSSLQSRKAVDFLVEHAKFVDPK